MEKKDPLDALQDEINKKLASLRGNREKKSQNNQMSTFSKSVDNSLSKFNGRNSFKRIEQPRA